jgi:hypothetical protein
MNKLSEYFCTAPWTHTFVSPQGERRLCCASRETPKFQRQYIDAAGGSQETKFNPDTLDEHWNSEYMKDIRKRILSGEKISQCDICNNQILNLHTYKKYFTETLFPHKIQEILDSTDETGYTTMQPISYDYRISNLCNFKCRMCGEQLSSSWEAEKIKHNKVSYQDSPWLVPETRQKIKTFQVDVLEAELQSAVDANLIEEIYWVGGEPLMWERHWSIMRQLVDTGQSKNVTVRYNTNLSRINYKDHKLYDYLPHFKNVNICASIDGVGDVGEYIRTGLVWDSWLKNFEQGMFLIDKYGDDAIVFDVTLTTPGLFDLKRLFDVVTELNVKTYLKTTFAFDPSIAMSPLCLPREILENHIRLLLEYIEPRITYKTAVYRDTLYELLKRETFEEQYPEIYREGLCRGKRNILHLESIRNQQVTFRETLNENGKQWWDSIDE